MDMPVAPGDVLLGKYRIERVLGKGGMGFVVAARHIELGQLFAIKFLLPEVLTDDEIVERFSREARAASQLRSEHITRVHDFGRMENGAPYMVMEHLDGCDLKELLAKDGPLPVHVAMTYLAQVCDAIAEAHAAGIVHRDLKPANLFLVRRRNGSPCIKVLDFGISKHLGARVGDLTRSNAMVGSPLYMSPEQITMSKGVDPRADIWALGVILYELPSGTSPFKGGSACDPISRILQDEPKPIRERVPNVPARVEAVIARCLRKDRDERFQSVEHLLAALEGADVPAAQPPLPTTTAKMAVVTRNRPISDSAETTAIQETSGERTPVTFGEAETVRVKRPPSSLALAAAAAACVVLLGGTLLAVRSVLAPRNEPAATSPALPESVDTSFVVAPSAAVPNVTLESSPQDAGFPEGGIPNSVAANTSSAPERPTPPPASTGASSPELGTATTKPKSGVGTGQTQSKTRKDNAYTTR